MCPTDDDNAVVAVEADESLRRFMSGNQCNCSEVGGVWTVFARLFYEPPHADISFHLKPPEWTDQDILKYRMAYPSIYEKVPGVLQMRRILFARASMPVPWLCDDADDAAEYRALHCTWPCPEKLDDADRLADIVTTALAAQLEARVVCKVEKLKNIQKVRPPDKT